MSILGFLLDLLYPPRCVFCSRILTDDEKILCSNCAQNLPNYMTSEVRRDIEYIQLCLAPFEYKGDVRASLHRYKFNGAAAYGSVYADFILKSIDENQISCDIISWVPLSRKRLRQRGYDQAEIIARALADKLCVPCERLLVKIKDNTQQSSIKSKAQRKANVAGAYRCIAKETLVDKRVLLVDDIVTSGSTLGECAHELRKHGCVDVYAAAVASPTR